MDSLFLLTQNSNKLLGPIAKVLGLIMNGIYLLLAKMGIHNIALTIIVFTVIIYLIMLPLTYQQQKFSKMSMIMNPEIQAIQKKYKNRKDTASMTAMNEETQAVYKKYGVKPSGSCVFMAITLLILFPLYRVIYNVPAYVSGVKDTFADVVNNIMATSGYQTTMTDFLATVSEKNSVFRGVSLNFEGTDAQAYDSIIDVLYKCTPDNWNLLADKFSAFSDSIHSTQSIVEHLNNFLGANIIYSPKALITTSYQEGRYILIVVAILIPLLSSLSQFLNTRLMPQPASSGQGEAMANQMKTMNYLMPLYSFFIVFFLPIGVGIYWIAGAVIRCIQQVVINKKLDKMDLEAIVKKNQAKVAAKEKAEIEKKGVKGDVISNAAKINTRQIPAKTMAEKAAAVSTASTNNSGKKYKQGSLASKANLVNEFNEKNSRK